MRKSMIVLKKKQRFYALFAGFSSFMLEWRIFAHRSVEFLSKIARSSYTTFSEDTIPQFHDRSYLMYINLFLLR